MKEMYTLGYIPRNVEVNFLVEKNSRAPQVK